MKASVQLSFFTSLDLGNASRRKVRRSGRQAIRLFQVDVESFYNEVESYEIEARDMAEAAEIAQNLYGADAYNMNIYDICMQ